MRSQFPSSHLDRRAPSSTHRNASKSGCVHSGSSDSCATADEAPRTPAFTCVSSVASVLLSSPRQRFILFAVALVVCLAFVPEVLHITQAHAAATDITCPYGWSLYESDHTATTITRQCVRVFATSSVPAKSAESACVAIFTNNGEASHPRSADGVTPWPFTRHVTVHGAAVRTAAENSFLQDLFLQAASNGLSDDAILILGGVAGYGVVNWYADASSVSSAGSAYTNFADDVNWQLHAGTVVMRPSGAWGLLPADSVTAAAAFPYVCAFDASGKADLPDSSSQQSSSGKGVASSSAAAHPPSAGSSSSGATPQHGNHRARRPAVPQPAPPCLDGWTPLPASVDTSEGVANSVCYFLFANASEVGGRLGKTFASAQACCSAAHPKATLASVMSREENAWVVSALLNQFPPSEEACNCDGQMRPTSTSSSSKSARTVFLGGSYMRDGTGAGLIGSWYADQYLFNTSEYASTSPSSPAWPTERNDYFSNWGKNEPLLSYGVVGITAPADGCVCNTSSISKDRGAAETIPSTAEAVAGIWVGVDPRSTQPFLCSYLNDGSTFPPTPPSTTHSPDSSSVPVPEPSAYCIPGWSYLEMTNSCYRVYPTASTMSPAAVTAATMEESCEQVLRGRVVPAKVGRVHAVSMMSTAESNYVGALLQLYLNDPANHVSTTSVIPVSLAGVSFIDYGESGFYISGVRELDPQLALSLWASAEPAFVKGCVAVDVGGLWYYVPCSTYTSTSTPENTAVQVQAYTCQYNAKDIDVTKDVIHATTTPEPSWEPGDSTEGSDGAAWLPLHERVTALSGATHLVVAAGSTGIYTLQGPNGTTPAVASVQGLHLYFAPLSAYYGYAAPTTAVDGTALGSIFAPTQAPPTSVQDLLGVSTDVMFSRPFSPCDGFKDQSRIARVRRNSITVHHGNTSEVGYVCISQDGRNYVPTAITYEVTEVTVHGFIPALSRHRDASAALASGGRPTWLPPLFCNSAGAAASACAVQQTLAIPQHGTGTVQLALRYSSNGGSTSSDRDVVATAQSPAVDTMISHLRFSASADCMGAEVPFYLLASEIALQHASAARYTRRSSTSVPANVTRTAAQYSIFSYQYAAVRAARFSSLRPIFNSSAAPSQLTALQPPAEYYVCVAAQKSSAVNASSGSLTQAGAASRRLLSMFNVSSSNGTTLTPAAWTLFSSSAALASESPSSSSSGSTFDDSAFLLAIADRLLARTSLSPTGAAVRTYTAVPGLKVHLIPPSVSIKGMWALPPRRLAQRTSPSNDSSGRNSKDASMFAADVATLVPTAATFNRSAHYHLRPTYAYTYTSATAAAPPQSSHDASSPVASVAHLHIPQYSSPIVLLDGHEVQPGMLALLSQDANRCNRLQPIPRSDPTATASTWPSSLDTMVPLSTVTMRVESPSGDDSSSSSSSNSNSNSSTVVTMAYMQLNLNHTGLWGHHPTRTDDPAAMEQTWYVCLAYNSLSPFMPLREPALKITVHRLHVERFAIDASAAFTSSDAAAAAEAADASTTHLNLNTGFAGMLWMHGLDVRLWATTTLHSAQVAFSVVLPSSGTPDDTATQCAHPSLFYSQQGLGLLTQDSSRRRGRYNSKKRRSASVSPPTDFEEGSGDDDDVDTDVGMVIPLGFFTRQSMRRMQLCLSVPLPFTTTAASVAAATDAAGEGVVPQHRFFAPLVNTTLDVRPIQLLYMGRYSAVPASTPTPPEPTASATTSGTVIRLAEGAHDVVLPLTGYGIRPDMTMFLSTQLCHGATTTDPSRIVASQSKLNISVVSLYDLPSSYWDTSADGGDDGLSSSDDGGRAHRPRVFVVLRNDDLLRKAAAQRLFREKVIIDPLTGVATVARVPLNVCLYAPGTATLVFPTDFQLVVDPPRVTAIRNLPSDAALLARAAASMPVGELSTLTPTAATVVYGGNMDLLVEGFGLDDTNTWLMPAVDCSNASSFLWRAPVRLSALPSSHTTTIRIEKSTGALANPLYANASRYVDPQTSYSSWFATLQQQETVRFGADDGVSTGQVVRRFQWCVRIVENDGTATPAEDAVPYVATHVPYQLLIPAVKGFALENARRGAAPSTALTLPTQHPIKGRWFPMQLVGPVVDLMHAIGSPLYMFLAPEAYTCHEVKNSYLNRGLYTFGNASFAAVNGSAVLLPRWLATAGAYRLCASAVYPTLAAADEGIEAALQFFTLDGLRVLLIQAVYGVFALNHTTTVTVEQGQEWTLPISGSMLTNRSMVRFQTSASKCATPMTATRSAGGGVLPDIPIQNDFAGFPLFGEDDASSELEGGTSVIVNGYYIVLSRSLIRALAAPASYVLCLQPQRSLAWRVAPSITLHVVQHVRHPTHYNYFPADGSEDVVAVTALAPTKVALEWNTGEKNKVNIVGAAGQQVSLGLWCFPTPNTATSNSSSLGSRSSINNSSDGGNSATGVVEELVPCGDHRRVMFVKPLDNDEDPCFVDAEAVPQDVLRGPFVVDFGVLTLPHSLSVVDSDTDALVRDDSSSMGAAAIVPNMTQPWIMCLETGPERWREPIYPMLQLQYTRAIPTGFRLGADDASNTTAPFPAHKPDVEATTTAEMDSATGMPLGGNTTLYLYAQDSSQVVYLNGYGIERGHKLRFGSFCEEEMLPPNIDGSSSSSSSGSSGSSSSSSGSNNSSSAAAQMSDYLARVANRQVLENPRLYAEPLTIEDNNGVFLVPSTHLLRSEDARSGSRGIPVCLSTNDGHTYKKTALMIRVLPSRLRTDTETQYRNLLAQILSNTLLVPQRSRGSVDMSELVKVAKGIKDASSPSSDSTITTASEHSSSYNDGDDDDDGATVPTSIPTVYVRVGTQVLFSASCSVNTHGLPLLTVNMPNIITLTEQHTAAATAERLLLCFRGVDAAASAAAAQPADANYTENDVGALTPAFLWYGLYYRVMGVEVDQVSLHPWAPTAAMAADNVNHVVLRRGVEEDLLLPVMIGATSAAATTSSAALSPEDQLLQGIERSPSAMSLLSLTRLYIGRPCFRYSSAPQPPTAVSPFVSSYAGMQLSFSADAVTVGPLAVDESASETSSAAITATTLNRTLVAALPSGDDLPVPQFPLKSRGSVCFSVDGGLQYLAVGIAQYTEEWAPTLRVTVDVEDNENNEDVAEVDDEADDLVTRGTTTALRVYAQSSTTRRLMDTRFVDPRRLTNESGSILQVLADLGRLTTTMLWSGFVGANGFAMDGFVYLPAASKITQAGTQQPQQPLHFSLDNRLQNIATNLTLTVVPWSLTCYGTATQHDVFVRQQDVGLYASTAPGVCSAGVRDGARVRVVPLSAAACDDPAMVDATYVMDLSTVQPGSWGVVTSTSSSSSSSSKTTSPSSTSPFRAMQFPMALRYVPEGTYALCLRQDLPFVSTVASSPTDSDEAADEVNRAIYTAVYTPTPLRLHVSYNWTILSISGVSIRADEQGSNGNTSTSSVVALAQSSNAEVAVTGTAVDVRGVPLLLAFAPGSAQRQQLTRRRLSATAATDNSSSSNMEDGVTSESWTWSDGCAGVPAAWDPETGASLIVQDTHHNGTTVSGASTGKLLSAPWYNAQDGVWKIDAAYLQNVDWQPQQSSSSSSTSTLVPYAVCYSVDDGLTFHPAGIASEFVNTDTSTAVPAPFTAVVVPPTVTSLSASRAVAPGVEATVDQLNWSPTYATATAVRVQLLSTSAAADAGLPGALPRVTSYSRVDDVDGPAYATRPQSYEYAWTGAFVGNGMGTESGRVLPPSAASTADVPTVAAAVALVRTSLHGARCDGVQAASADFTTFRGRRGNSNSHVIMEDNWENASTASPLAAPIFVVNLQHGGVWSPADTAAVAAWRAAQTNHQRVTAFDKMNVVLAHETWLADTAAMWAANDTAASTSGAAAPLNGLLLTGHPVSAALAAARSNGESVLVCLSTDGSHFYSADVARAAVAGVASAATMTTVSAAGLSSVAAAQLSPWPLYLRARAPATVESHSASAGATTTTAITTPALLWMREAAMVMELLVRPVTATSQATRPAPPSLAIDAAALTRFQAALAAQLGVEASVVVVQLTHSGVVTLPQSDVPAASVTTPATTTATPTTTTSAAPVSRRTTGATSVLSTDDVVMLSATAAVQARHGVQATTTAAAMTATAAGENVQAAQLLTYALVVSIVADAVAYNATAATGSLTASPDLLYRTVAALRSNVTGPALLSTLVADRTTSSAAAALALHPLTVNFTMSNGMDLHTAAATMAEALPTSPPQEVAWRALFLSIPYATVVPAPVPDAEDNDTTSKVSWWVIPILLVLPACMGYGTYYVYKKYLKKAPEEATQVTVENAQ